MTDSASRVRLLRSQLNALGVDGFIQPTSDEYLGEYVPASAARLAWLSGFTGSAGLAVVLPERAALFSDGRYQLQIAQQADAGVWERQHIHQTPPPHWLQAHAAGLRIGYDPRIMAASDLQSYLDAGCTMLPLQHNPIDPIWEQRPAQPATPLSVQAEVHSGRSVTEKIALITHQLQQRSQDAVVLTDPSCIAWLLDVRADDLPYLPVALGYAIVSSTGTVRLFVDPARADAQVRAHLGAAVAIESPDTLAAALASLAGQRVRLDAARSPVWFAQQLAQAGAETVNEVDPCLLPRACKTEAERVGMRHAHLLDGIALSRFQYWLEHEGLGKTELEASRKILELRQQNDECLGASFPSIACAGPNAAIMHYLPTAESDRAIEPGSFFLLDSGGQYRCGTTDVTRTTWMGEGLPPVEWRSHYTRVLKGLIALSCAVFPAATPGYRLDPLARFALWEAGLDFDHGAGHGLGSYLCVHEWPLGFTRRPVLDPIYAGMVLTNEPGYYAPGSHGIRLENAMETLPAHDGESGQFLRFQPLTLAPIDRRGIELDLLTVAERSWLDAYHARVLEDVGPHLEGEEAAWLAHACRPL